MLLKAGLYQKKKEKEKKKECKKKVKKNKKKHWAKCFLLRIRSSVLYVCRPYLVPYNFVLPA